VRAVRTLDGVVVNSASDIIVAVNEPGWRLWRDRSRIPGIPEVAPVNEPGWRLSRDRSRIPGIPEVAP
jgi:hypothetical protein